MEMNASYRHYRLHWVRPPDAGGAKGVKSGGAMP